MAGETAPQVTITVMKDGPYAVRGEVPVAQQTIVADAEGTSRSWAKGRDFAPPASGEVPEGEFHLCRCGHSANKPFCDGSHTRVGFVGTEAPTARVPYLEQAQEQDGPELVLTDAQRLCAFARFCDADGQIWNQVEQQGKADLVEQEAKACVGGRLVAWQVEDRRATALETDTGPEIGVVQDPQQGVSGGYRVWGGITLRSDEDGFTYETRERIALCRCGRSRNKPFCDGSHAQIGFKDPYLSES
ncbi:CDGSH iron-sulfur domain-containing protein [Streptomyces sp. NPDC048659]|uniref:CDGSH iron-sulfur domain-containing protein n=1 Tax=Streptomyces sp. NPDC048659 TaxID=3155489 RepID=UPI003449680A